MTLAEIIRAQLATGRPLRVTLALLEALDASETDSGDLAAYDRARAAERELADLDLVLPAACGSRVDAARELARERDEARATMLAMRKQRDDYADRLDAAQALAEPPAVLADDPLYSSWTELCRALALPASTPGPAIVAAVVAIRETARHDREERDEARRELSHRPTMIAHTAACRERDEARDIVNRCATALRRHAPEMSVRGGPCLPDEIGHALLSRLERGARWALATFFGPESSALVDRSREAARICEAARKAGGHE